MADTRATWATPRAGVTRWPKPRPLEHRPWTTLGLVIHAVSAGLSLCVLAIGVLMYASGTDDRYVTTMSAVLIVAGVVGLLVSVPLLVWTVGARRAADDGRPGFIAPLAWTQLVIAAVEIALTIIVGIGGAGGTVVVRLLIDVTLIIASIQLLRRRRAAQMAPLRRR